MPSNVDTLMEMGFPRNRAEKALHKTNYKSVQLAMDWLFSHSEDPDIDDPFEAPKGHSLTEETPQESTGEPAATSEGGDVSADAAAATAVAKSLKCDDCGKLLKTPDAAQLHAARSGHENFSESTEEIKPLTEEEKKVQLEKLQERLKQKRIEKEEKEKEEATQREKLRRVQGRDLTAVKQKMEQDEMKRAAELRRKEKADEKMARQKVLEQIERDKKNRAALFSKTAQESSPAAPAATVPVPQAAPAAKKDYDKCRIQIRLTNGQTLTETFGAKEQLACVRLYVDGRRTDGNRPYNFMTNFPKKLFTDDDMEKPLSELGLVPSAVLIVSNKS